MQVTFPWPLKELSPNARLHWSKVAKAKKAYRKVCWALALEAGVAGKFDQAQRLSVHMVFYPPDRRERDEDNLVASMKSGLDGLADALGINDRKFKPTQDVAEQIGGYVIVEIKPMQ